MSLDFSKVTSWRVPEGEVSEVTDAQGNILWSIIEKKYVSLGDSIAAGHTINSDWEKSPLDVNKGYYEGTKSQYTETLDGASQPNQKTIIVNNSYTDRINKDLKTKYGTSKIYTLSFAHSGDTVADLIAKLNHNRVKNAIKKADIVTISIGANDILGLVSEEVISDYINAGSLTDLENAIETNLNLLDADSNPNSYISLFKKLAEEINPNAKYIFTTVYNPYKYLWIEEGKDGFFAPLLGAIPDMNIIGLDIDGLIKDGLLNTTIVQRLFERVNKLGVWVEKYITRLNTILKNKINSYRSINPNFTIADTKSLFDVFPDRPENAQWHYNDLVNVEYTKGYNTATMDWGRLYEESGGASTFWWNLSYKYISSAGFDINGFATDLVAQIIEKVIVPDLDPHPETYGQYVLSRSFEDAIGLSSLDSYTITYNSNGGDGSMSSRIIYSVDGLPAYNIALDPVVFAPPQTGYYFTGWKDQYGNSYNSGDLIVLTGDLILYAQWSNVYNLKVDAWLHNDNGYLGFNDNDTGRTEDYEVYKKNSSGNWEKIVDSVGTINRGPIDLSVVYGDVLRVCVRPYNYAEASWLLGSASGNIWNVSRNWVDNSAFATAFGGLLNDKNGSITEDKCRSHIYVKGTQTAISKTGTGDNYNDWIYTDVKILGDASIGFEWYAPKFLSASYGQYPLSGSGNLQVWNCWISGNVSDKISSGNGGHP